MELLFGIISSIIAAILCGTAVYFYRKMKVRRQARGQTALPAQTPPPSLSIEGKRVQKTFLFTDIVKSTDIRAACVRELGDKGNECYDNEVLAQHDEILNRLIRQFAGEIVSTEGDSYFAAFTYARDAVECAVAIQRDFTGQKISLPVAGADLPPHLQIRIGLHTGGARELVRVGQPNYSDHNINIAARIKSHALGEQVLMSQETWNSTGRLKDIANHDWTGYKLRGVDGVWTLVEALWDGREPRQPQTSPDTPSPTSIATVAAFDIFGGRVEILTDDLLSHPASSTRVSQFYAGAKLDWDIITAHGDIPRDQQDELLKQASEPFEEMRFNCIVAEPGAGKSTLAWRIAAELHKQHKALVIHIKGSEDADVWYRLPEFCAKVVCPFYVLVDDVFHDPEVTGAFHELNPWLPITVLATSPANEYRARRLKCEVLRFDLEPPSLNEKDCILKRLGKTRSDFTSDQQRRLDAANQFLVLMMELTEGKALREIVRDSMERLRELDEAAYRAYEYLCFAYQYSIAMPASLLERLDVGGRFHNLQERETTQGLIFWDSRKGHVRVGHSIIAETAAALYAQHHSPQGVLTEIATNIDMSNAIERSFLAHLLRALAQAKSPILTSLPEPLENSIIRCVASAGRIVELSVWRAFYRYLGQNKQAEKCLDLAMSLKPASSTDCNMLLKVCRERGKEREALPKIAKWIEDHPESGGARCSYLGLIERYGTGDDLAEALGETSDWLATHQDDNYVRGHYLGLVERKGTDEQVAQVVQGTSAWLATHQDDSNVRAAYLGLVEHKGTDEQVAQVVKETSAWLAEHQEDVTLRQTWLGFIEAHGSAELKEAVISETKAWLLKRPSAKEVCKALLGWLFRAGRSDEATELTRTAISHVRNSQELIEQYLRVLQDTADEQTVKKIYEQLIAEYPRHVLAQLHYSDWLRDRGYHTDSEKRYKALLNLPLGQTTRFLRRRSYYSYGMLLLKLERFDKLWPNSAWH